MKPLPNFNDTEAMALRGRRSFLGSARNEATEALRDAHAAIQSAEWDRLHQAASKAHEAVERLKTVAVLWTEIEEEDSLVPLLQASIAAAKAAKA